jgi:hypothetical protein
MRVLRGRQVAVSKLRARGKGFYERGCQVKTLLLLQEGLVFLGIQPLSMTRTILNARVWAGVFPCARVRGEGDSELEQAFGVAGGRRAPLCVVWESQSTI